jgi:hypothetical protein
MPALANIRKTSAHPPTLGVSGDASPRWLGWKGSRLSLLGWYWELGASPEQPRPELRRTLRESPQQRAAFPGSMRPIAENDP